MEFDVSQLGDLPRLMILAVVQGIAEFLPISSSGHLNVGAEYLGGKPNHRVNIALHFGTLLSILLYYRVRILDLLRSDRRVIPLLIVGTMPAVIVGLAIKKIWPWLEEDLLVTGVMLCITGMGLCWFQKLGRRHPDESGADDSPEAVPGKSDGSAASEEIPSAGSGSATGERSQHASREETVTPLARGKDYAELRFGQAILIGCFQAFAILPGISRSGSTILAGLLVGLKDRSAATFSFLLAIPAILGATVLEVVDVVQRPTEGEYSLALLGLAMLVSFVVGLLSLALLVKMLSRGILHWFAIWVLPLGMIVIIWQLYEQFSERI